MTGRIDRTALLLGTTSTLAFLIFQQGGIVHADGEEVYQLTRSLTEHASLAIDPNPDFPIPGDDNIGSPGRGGDTYSRYGIGMSLLGIPFYAVGLLLSAIFGHADLIQGFFVASLMPVLCGCLVAVLYLLGRRLGAGPRASAIVAAGAVAGTFALPYTKEYFSEPVLALFLALMLERAIARHPVQASAALCAAALVRPQALAFAPVLLLVTWRLQGLRCAVLATVPIAATVGLLVGYNWLRFENPIATGYETDEGFNTPIQTGTWGLLTSPDKSLFLFCPAILLLPVAIASLWSRERWGMLLVLGNFLVTFVVTATWSGWDGDWAWGPRLLIPGLIPVLMLLAPLVDARLRMRRAAIALFAVGFLVSVPAAIVPMQTQQDDRVLSPGIVRQLELVPETVSYTAGHLGSAGDGDANHRRWVSTWQVLVGRELGPAAMLATLLISLGLLAATAVAGRALARALRADVGAGPGPPRPAG